MSRGYGKYRRGGHSHANFIFDNIFKENSNKPSAARSAATVGKWGITSFTSIRTINGLSREAEKPAAESAPKPKKFFKSRNADNKASSNCSDRADNTYSSAAKRARTTQPKDKEKEVVARERPTRSTASRKFFASKAASVSPEHTVLTTNNTNRAETSKPPIVLRICRGKSQLVNDSDESESTPTPSSTPSTSNATSPRAIQRSPNCRITRSARRSMQQDPSSSPATADTPGEFSLFTSPKKELDLSPQYIPAEKYELERKAMYDNLLRPNSPDDKPPDEPPETSVETPETSEIPQQMETGESLPEDDLSTVDMEEDESAAAGRDIIVNSDVDADVKMEVPSDSPDRENRVDVKDAPNEEPEVNESSKIEDEWSDSDSNSTTPDADTGESYKERTETSKDNQIEDHKEEILEKILEKPPEVIPKLVITKKKGSIFKSRSLVADGTKMRRALYRHKWSNDDNKEGTSQSSEGQTNNAVGDTFADDFGFQDDPLVRVIKSKEDSNEDPENRVSSIKCAKGDKGYYTVVRNVKKAHQMQEIGEFQEFNDDVDYILDTLQDSNPISTRCLSAISLATKCMAPAFRMHVRAHGTVAKFFKSLHDATKDQSLGLCTATVMFVLSQDRLNMDLDRDCLELMLNLLESDVSYQQALDICGLSSAQLEKNKQKVRELCAEMQGQGHAMHLNLDNITVGQLAMETLLSLTSKRAGEWFKEELRELGGLEHIMKTICECCRQVSDYVVSWTDTLLDKLRKVDRCLRVLENVTHNNEENQTYLLKYNDGLILDTLVNLYKLCDGEIPLYPVTDITDKESTGTIIREALLVTLKVLITLTHHYNDYSIGSSLIGSRPGIIETSLHLLLQVPHYIPEQKKFELGVLVLMLLINLIQDNSANKKLLMEAKAPSKLESIYSREESAVEALIAQFYDWEQCAKIAEKRTNAILDGEKDVDTEPTVVQHKSNEEFIEETVAKLLQKAGTHMEYTFLASYIVLLVGFLMMDSDEYQKNIRQFLRGNNFTDMVEILNKFYNFMNLTASTEASSVCAIKATKKVLKLLEDCNKAAEAAPEPPVPVPVPAVQPPFTECMDLSYTMPQ